MPASPRWPGGCASRAAGWRSWRMSTTSPRTIEMSDIPTIADAARLIAGKRLSPVELTQACLGRIRALDNRLHAFVHLTEERALTEARAAEAAIMAGGPKGPL